MSIRAGLASYYNLFGARGVLAISAHRLFGKPKEIVVRPNGVKHPIHLRVRTSDISVYSDVVIKRDYDIQLPNPPRTIVDAGANIGLATIYYANKYPEAKIVAVEPEPTNYSKLLRNVAPYPNVIPVNAALWNRDCEVHLGAPGQGSTPYDHWAFQVMDKGTPVRGITMETLMKETVLDSIGLLKMDIEGGEIEALDNCDWMACVDSIVIELHDRIRPGCRAALKKATKGFNSWEHGEMTFCLRSR